MCLNGDVWEPVLCWKPEAGMELPWHPELRMRMVTSAGGVCNPFVLAIALGLTTKQGRPGVVDVAKCLLQELVSCELLGYVGSLSSDELKEGDWVANSMLHAVTGFYAN